MNALPATLWFMVYKWYCGKDVNASAPNLKGFSGATEASHVIKGSWE